MKVLTQIPLSWWSYLGPLRAPGTTEDAMSDKTLRRLQVFPFNYQNDTNDTILPHLLFSRIRVKALFNFSKLLRKLSNLADAFVFLNSLLSSQRPDNTGGKEKRHIVPMTDLGVGRELQKGWREPFRKNCKWKAHLWAVHFIL